MIFISDTAIPTNCQGSSQGGVGPKCKMRKMQLSSNNSVYLTKHRSTQHIQAEEYWSTKGGNPKLGKLGATQT